MLRAQIGHNPPTPPDPGLVVLSANLPPYIGKTVHQSVQTSSNFYLRSTLKTGPCPSTPGRPVCIPAVRAGPARVVVDAVRSFLLLYYSQLVTVSITRKV